MSDKTKAALTAENTELRAKVAEADACAARALEGRDEMIRQCQALEAENARLRECNRFMVDERRISEDGKTQISALKLELQIARAQMRLMRLAAKKRG